MMLYLIHNWQYLVVSSSQTVRSSGCRRTSVARRHLTHYSRALRCQRVHVPASHSAVSPPPDIPELPPSTFHTIGHKKIIIIITTTTTNYHKNIFTEDNYYIHTAHIQFYPVIRSSKFKWGNGYILYRRPPNPLAYPRNMHHGWYQHMHS